MMPITVRVVCLLVVGMAGSSVGPRRGANLSSFINLLTCSSIVRVIDS